MWCFEGVGTQINFGISPRGNLKVYGNCAQDCKPQAGDLDFFRTVSGVNAAWSLHSPSAEQREYEPVERGLKDFFEANDGRAAALIEYAAAFEYEGRQHPACVYTSILMPQPVFKEAVALLKSIMGRQDLSYLFILDFFGLMPPEAPPWHIPNVSEFVNPDIISRRAYLSNEVSLRVHSRTP